MIKEFVLSKLAVIYKGTIGQKIVASAQLSVLPAGAITLTERLAGWYLESEFFLFLLCVVLAVDHIIGSYTHWKVYHDFSFKKNLEGLLSKLSILLMGFIVLSVIHKVLEPIEFFKNYFSVLVQLMIILYPGTSALTNMSILTNGKFPPVGFLDKIKNFHKSADISDLKDKKDRDEDN